MLTSAVSMCADHLPGCVIHSLLGSAKIVNRPILYQKCLSQVKRCGIVRVYSHVLQKAVSEILKL